jgi:hypothetical protein
MYDYPDTAGFLTAAEKKEVVRRLEHDRNVLADEFDLKYFRHAISDWKIWVHMFITIGIYTPLYSISLFMPTIVKNMNYTNETAQLMTVPPYVAACIFTIGGGLLADRHNQRGIYMIGCNCIAYVFSLPLWLATRTEKLTRPQKLGWLRNLRCHGKQPRPLRRLLPRRLRHLSQRAPRCSLERQQHRRVRQARCRHRHARRLW